MDPRPKAPAACSYDELKAGMRALVRTLAPSGSLGGGAARVVSAVQWYLGTDFHVASLAPIGVVELATRVTHPWMRQQLVRAMVVGALIDGEPTRVQLERIRSIAAALKVDEPGIVDLELYLGRRRWRLRRHLVGRFWAVDRLKARIAERGFWRAVVPAVMATLFGIHRDKQLALRFAGLRQLPPASFGRAFLDYLAENEFPLPGERGAVSDIIVAHDLAHVLAEYGTAPHEEVLVACFSAGHRVKDPFAMVLFVLFQFHLGVQMTPGAKPEVGKFHPHRVVEAIARGATVTEDLTGPWSYWPLLSQPLDQVRERLGVTPRHGGVARARAA